MLENLINDLIDLAKIENNKFSLNQEYADLVETIESALSLLLFQANEKNIEFNVIIDNKQNISRIEQIFIDTRRLKQILINFISNSLKFTPVKGKIDIVIQINQEQKILNELVKSNSQSLI